MVRRCFVFFCFLIMVISNAGPAAAKDAGEVQLGKIVITPSRFEEYIGEVAGSITVISGSEMRQNGVYSVLDALRDEGGIGIDVAQAGGLGGATSIFLRGANSGHTRVMIDGVRVYDPISTNASFDFAHLTMDNIDRIEILKGPQSMLYGTDAMGGVINIITKKGEGKQKTSLMAEAGSFYTHRQALDVSGEESGLHYAFSGSHLKSKGFSKAKEKNNNPEEDHYENYSFSSRLGYDLSESTNLDLITRYTDAEYEYDSSYPIADDPNKINFTKQGSISGVLNQKLSDNLEHKLQLSWMRNYRKDVDDPPPTGEYLRDWFDGRTQQADWYMIYRPNNTYTVTTGLNYLRERGESYYYSIHPIFGTTESIFSKSYAWTKGVFIENKLNLSDKFFATAGIRLEDHSRFDTSETYKIDALYSFDTGTKLKGTFATGFKAPSLYQLYVPADASFGGGNANLQPEENETYEVGIEQSLLEDKLSFGTTYFHTIFKNLIDTTWNTTTGITEQYKNVGKAKAFGYESQIRFQPFKKFKAIGNYTWLDTEDKDTHDELLRRAKNKFDITLDYSLTEKLGLASTLRYVGHRQDSGGQLLKAYTRVDISTNYDISEECNIFGRIENLFNEKYEEIKGYQTPGFSVYVGTKYSF